MYNIVVNFKIEITLEIWCIPNKKWKGISSFVHVWRFSVSCWFANAMSLVSCFVVSVIQGMARRVEVIIVPRKFQSISRYANIQLLIYWLLFHL